MLRDVSIVHDVSLLFPIQDNYAERAVTDGFYLGIGDFALLATVYNVTPTCLHFDDERAGFPELVNVRDRVGNLLDPNWCESTFPADLASDKTWTVAWCRSDYKRGKFTELNHAIPLFSKAQVGDDWASMVQLLCDKIKQRAAKIQKQLDQVSDDSDGAIETSLQFRLSILENKLQMFQLLIENGFMPVDVPADGNCLLWSVRCLHAGVGRKLVTDRALIMFNRRAAWQEGIVAIRST